MTAQDLSASEAARLVGVAVTTLRTWDRRYGLGPRGHQAGQHRRYSTDDLDRLLEMQRLTARGVPAAQAATWVMAGPDADRDEPVRRDGGGHAVAVGDNGPAVRGLTRAALRLDGAEIRIILHAALASDGVVATWTTLIAPALVQVGLKQAATKALIEVEHLLSAEVSRMLASIPLPGEPSRVLLACADEEQHSLALEALGAALAERGVATRQLGPRVPSQALLDAIARTGPDAVVLWSQTTATADPAQLSVVLAARPAIKTVVAAGPGWNGDQIPDGAVTPNSLASAVALLTRTTT
ncbi:MerR family transcriptional regulator [Hamadaea tsunoensis]|uniref:MerR family transcriptional regulator n=1 Tax=Hamadaea tsunoensis TaxID=53368 RepID=UPI00041D7EE8|nr:MerR family transcriptional regulator [Hamadaea tsunoensis]